MRARDDVVDEAALGAVVGAVSGTRARSATSETVRHPDVPAPQARNPVGNPSMLTTFFSRW
jgi:hypothetical protein